MGDPEPAWDDAGDSASEEPRYVGEFSSPNGHQAGYTVDAAGRCASAFASAESRYVGEFASLNGHQGGYRDDTEPSWNDAGGDEGGESWCDDPDGKPRADKWEPDPEFDNWRDSSESDTDSDTGSDPDPSVAPSEYPRLPDAASATSIRLCRTTAGAASAMLTTEKIRRIRAIVLSRCI
jgi:hypothetical protein